MQFQDSLLLVSFYLKCSEDIILNSVFIQTIIIYEILLYCISEKSSSKNQFGQEYHSGSGPAQDVQLFQSICPCSRIELFHFE